MIGFYRALLRLYPTGFRQEYGDELTAAFADRMREHDGPLAPVTLFVAAIADVLPNALAAHWDIFKQDARYASRALRRAPGFSLTAILVVALGVGANTAAFSLADFVLLRPLPFPEGDRLVKVWQTSPGYGQMELAPPNYYEWKAATTSSFSSMGAYANGAVNLVGDGEPERLETALVTGHLMATIGVDARIGRQIIPEDTVAGGAVVLSHAIWRSRFGGDPNILGRTVRLNDVPHRVVGVMPAGYHYPSRQTDLWVPLILGDDDAADRNNNYFYVVGRLAPGVTIERARAELAAAAARSERENPRENLDVGASVLPVRAEMGVRARTLVLAVCGAALCILLLACANLASLLLARGVGRGRELAVRAALGAGRDRLVRQLITESVSLAVIGGLVGVGVAIAGLPLLARLVPANLPIAEHPTLDLRVLGFAAALIVVTGVTFGIAPALRAGRERFDALRDGTRTAGGRRQRVRSALVVVEITASVVLLICAGLLVRAILRIQAVDPGFDGTNVVAVQTTLPLPRYAVTDVRAGFYRRVIDEVRALPGVENAAYGTGLPMAMRGGIWPVGLAGDESVRSGDNSASLRYVTPGFFSTLGIPVKRGRDVAPGDAKEGLWVAVVSESFVRRHWPNEDPIGKRFNFALGDRVVVGVVGDVRFRGLEGESEPQVYLAATQVPDSSIVGYIPKELIVRSSAPIAQTVAGVRRILASADQELPISAVRTIEDILGEETASRRVQLNLLAILAAIALVIAGVGIHGLLSFAVSERTQELGIRRALGAQASAMVGMVVREGLLLALIGTVLGVGAAILAARGMSALLFGIPPGDPATIAAAVGLCIVMAIAGCLRPAIRAARVDPMTALREG